LPKIGDVIPVQIDLTGRLITGEDATKIIQADKTGTVSVNFQTLTNMLYTSRSIKAIPGMTKVNSTTLSSHPKVRGIFQFRKTQPDESHILVQAYNAGETESRVFKNDALVPATGDFNATSLHTDASGAGKGRFSDAPLAHVCYCNSVQTMIWGGDESKIAGFLVYDAQASTFIFDYTEKVKNLQTDADNIATLTRVSGVGSEVLLLLHCDGTDGSTTFTDSSPTTPHTVTAVGNAQIDTADKKFGTAAGLFDGTGDWLTIPDNADFDLSGGTWTIDMWVNVDSLAAERGLYSQGTTGADTDYMAITITTGGAVKLSIFAVGVEVLDTAGLQTADSVVLINTWTHIRVVENGDDYYIFVNGVEKAYVADTERPADYNSVVVIGARRTGDTTGLPYIGHIDEIRLTNTAASTSNFDVPASAYGTNATTYLYVGSVMPIAGIKFYVGTANTGAGAMSIFYWNGSAWVAVGSLVDGTASGGAALAQTGSVTFTSTASTAKTRIVEGILGFWYRVEITNCDNTTTVSRVTLNVPFQPIQDLWDQLPRPFVKVYIYDGTRYKENTVNVFRDEYYFDNTTGGDTSTYLKYDAKTSANSIVVGALERARAIQIKLIPEHENTTASTILTADYWNGTQWVRLAMTDGTSQSGISLTQSGYIIWTPKGENVEFKRSINEGEGLYFYRLNWNKTMSADVKIFFMSYIPVERNLQGYKFSINAKNRLMLFSDQYGEKNKMIVSNLNTLNVFNGKDTGDPIFFGKNDVDIEAAVEIFARFTGSLKSMIVVCQKNATHVLFGDNPEEWLIPPFPISSTVGCSATNTMKASPIGFEFAPLETRQVAMWVHSTGVQMFDPTGGINEVSDDIRDLFDQRESGSINLDAIDISYAFWDVFNGNYYYHICVPIDDSTVCNAEYAFDFKRHKWYQVDRTVSAATNKDLQCGVEVTDASGANYTYGAEDNGYLQRLNNGTDFDGNDIVASYRIGDMAVVNGSTLLISKLRYLQLPQVAKTITANNINCTHFADGQDTGNSFNLSPLKTGRRLAIPSMSQGADLDAGVFHSILSSLTTDDETVGYEPLYMSARFEIVREDKGEVS
jgi:hypothetical protein